MGTLPFSHVQPGGQHSVGSKGRQFAHTEVDEDAESNPHTSWMTEIVRRCEF